MHVEEMMQHHVITAPPDLSLTQALERMQQHRVRHLPVVVAQQLLGVITDRDLRRALPSSVTALHPDDAVAQLAAVTIATCMAVPLVTVLPTVNTVEAAQQLLEGKFGCLPVVEQGKLVGIVTATDFLRGFLAAAVPAGELMSVRDYMHASPLTITPTDSVETAYHGMRAAQIRHLPVVTAERQLLGMITDRDIRQAQPSDVPALAVYEQGQALDTLMVQEIMATPVVTVMADTPVADAGQLLLARRVGCLPVVREDKTLVGILTVRDLVRAYVQQHGVVKTAAPSVRLHFPTLPRGHQR